MRFTSIPAAAFGVILIAACADSSGPANSPQFSREITFDEFEQTLTTSAARVEIELQAPTASGPAVAREVEIQKSEDQRDEESVEAAALRFEGLENSATACRGTIVLAPAFTIQFDAATTDFEGRDEMDISCAQFVEQVQLALDSGRSVVVEGERAPPAEPQAPGDASFAAAELKLEGDDDEEPEVEINVDADNILACSTLPNAPTGCVGVIQVLGVSIAVVDGVTELESEIEHEDMDDDDFEGSVASVTRDGSSCTLGSVTLENGTVVQIVAETELKNHSGHDDRPSDLCAVETALAAGTAVEAKGKGLVTSETPRTILAAEVEFEAEDDDDSSGPGH
jgi:hypothetical protein